MSLAQVGCPSRVQAQPVDQQSSRFPSRAASPACAPRGTARPAGMGAARRPWPLAAVRGVAGASLRPGGETAAHGRAMRPSTTTACLCADEYPRQQSSSPYSAGPAPARYRHGMTMPGAPPSLASAFPPAPELLPPPVPVHSIGQRQWSRPASKSEIDMRSPQLWPLPCID